MNKKKRTNNKNEKALSSTPAPMKKDKSAAKKAPAPPFVNPFAKSATLPPKKTAQANPQQNKPDSASPASPSSSTPKPVNTPQKKAPVKPLNKNKSMEEEKKKTEPVVLQSDKTKKQNLTSKEEAISFFDSSDTTSQEVDKGLELADLKTIGKVKGLRGKYKKDTNLEEVERLRKDIIKAADNLLKVAGTSIEDLTTDQKKKKKNPFTIKQKLSSSSEKGFVEDDVAVLTHEEVGDIQNVDLKTTDEIKDHKAAKTPDTTSFTPNGKTEEDIVDPFALEKKTPVSAANPLYSPEVSKLAQRNSSKGFFHYFGLTAVSLGLLAALGFGVYFLVNLLTDQETPDYAALSTQREQRAQQAEAEEEEVTLKTTLARGHQSIEEAKSILEKYFAADEMRTAYAFVAQSSSLREVFSKYWEAERFLPDQLSFNKAFKLPNGATWVSFKYGEEGKGKQLVLIKPEGGSFRLDWKAFTEIENVPLKEVIAADDTNPYLIRAWVTPEHVYIAGYEDSHWQNYAAYDIQGKRLSCYLALSTRIAADIFTKIVNFPEKYPSGLDPKAKGAYVKMLVRKPSIGEDFVEVLDIIDTTWFPELED